MEETMCTGRDCFVAIDAAGADDTNRRLCAFHDASLHTAGVRTKDDVGMRLHKERVLHVSCRMVICKVHGTIDVPVILHFGTLGEREAQTREDIDNLVLHDGERVART